MEYSKARFSSTVSAYWKNFPGYQEFKNPSPADQIAHRWTSRPRGTQSFAVRNAPLCISVIRAGLKTADSRVWRGGWSCLLNIFIVTNRPRFFTDTGQKCQQSSQYVKNCKSLPPGSQSFPRPEGFFRSLRGTFCGQRRGRPSRAPGKFLKNVCCLLT